MPIHLEDILYSEKYCTWNVITKPLKTYLRPFISGKAGLVELNIALRFFLKENDSKRNLEEHPDISSLFENSSDRTMSINVRINMILEREKNDGINRFRMSGSKEFSPITRSEVNLIFDKSFAE